MQSVLQSAVI